MNLFKKFFEKEKNKNKIKRPTSNSYLENDNLGSRQDTLGLANAYWIARNTTNKEEPFIVYTFKEEINAREALLEMPCIHVAEDSQKLICTETFFFGCYPTEFGQYEAVIGGDDLTHELWQKAKDSFVKHGGVRRNDLEPKRASTEMRTFGSRISDVTFSHEEQKVISGVTMTYRVFKGPNAESAKVYLQKTPVTRKYYFIVVETPEGNYCKDIQGIYKE
jgi:hypothetical protein